MALHWLLTYWAGIVAAEEQGGEGGDGAAAEIFKIINEDLMPEATED